MNVQGSMENRWVSLVTRPFRPSRSLPCIYQLHFDKNISLGSNCSKLKAFTFLILFFIKIFHIDHTSPIYFTTSWQNFQNFSSSAFFKAVASYLFKICKTSVRFCYSKEKPSVTFCAALECNITQMVNAT